jgi:chorismate dehydratase
MSSNEIPKLRMARHESAEELAHRVLARNNEPPICMRTRERLVAIPGPVPGGVRAGTETACAADRGIEDQVVLAAPSRLAQMLERDELDAALVSVVAVLFSGRYDILDGIAVASLGEVRSVLLAHRRPLEEARVIHCDPASLTSVQLLRVLLAERGLKPEFKPLPSYDFSALPDYALLIGDTALDLRWGPHEHENFRPEGGVVRTDAAAVCLCGLGAATGHRKHRAAGASVREARDFGLDTLDHIIASRTEYTLDFRRDYLGWHIHYHLGSDEKRGIARFMELLRKHGCGEVHEPKFVS